MKYDYNKETGEHTYTFNRNEAIDIIVTAKLLINYASAEKSNTKNEDIKKIITKEIDRARNLISTITRTGSF